MPVPPWELTSLAAPASDTLPPFGKQPWQQGGDNWIVDVQPNVSECIRTWPGRGRRGRVLLAGCRAGVSLPSHEQFSHGGWRAFPQVCVWRDDSGDVWVGLGALLAPCFGNWKATVCFQTCSMFWKPGAATAAWFFALSARMGAWDQINSWHNFGHQWCLTVGNCGQS